MWSVETDERVPLALVDVGDTLADCTPALLAALARLREPGDDAIDLSRWPLPAVLEMRCREVMSLPGFWRNLAPRAAGFTLLSQLHDAGYRVMILTKGPQQPVHAWAEKVDWCREHLPGIPVTVTDDKSAVPGDLLVDDWLPYVDRWQRRWPAGRVIVPAHPWNDCMVPDARRMRDDGNSGTAIAEWLRH